MKAIVTLKWSPIDEFDVNARDGRCVAYPHKACSDPFGRHHSVIEEGTDIEDIKAKTENYYRWYGGFIHITRVEVIEE